MIFTSENELYLRDKVALATNIMQSLNDIIPQVTPNLQQDLTDNIVDIFNLQEALHFHIDIHLTLSRKVQEARVDIAKLQKELAETKILLNDAEGKLGKALGESL